MLKSNRLDASFIFLFVALAAYYGGTRIRSSQGEAVTIAAASMIGVPDRKNDHTDSSQVIFKKIEPILARCTPCHFQGGKMYSKLPFDSPKTIQFLGDKLFTRIKDQKEQDLIRAFLAASSDTSSNKVQK